MKEEESTQSTQSKRRKKKPQRTLKKRRNNILFDRSKFDPYAAHILDQFENAFPQEKIKSIDNQDMRPNPGAGRLTKRLLSTMKGKGTNHEGHQGHEEKTLV